MVKIAVVDDEEGIREILQAYLGSQSHEVSPYSSGNDLLDSYRSGYEPDAIFMDERMANGSGLKTLGTLSDEGFDTSRVCMMSGTAHAEGHGGRTMAEEAQSYGARYMEKPFMLSQVGEALGQMLSE